MKFSLFDLMVIVTGAGIACAAIRFFGWRGDAFPVYLAISAMFLGGYCLDRISVGARPKESIVTSAELLLLFAVVILTLCLLRPDFFYAVPRE